MLVDFKILFALLNVIQSTKHWGIMFEAEVGRARKLAFGKWLDIHETGL